jgi:hypothetical protein
LRADIRKRGAPLSPAGLPERRRSGIHNVEVITGIECFIAEEFVNVTVQLRSSRLRGHLHRSGSRPPELGSVVGGQHLDFLNGVQAGENHQRAGGPVQPGVEHVAAIDFEGVVLDAASKSTKQANVLSFAISGTDPITGTKIAAYTVYEIGAAPIVFLTTRQGNLKNVSNASEQQLQQVLSGTNCDAGAFGSSFSGPINVFLRDPLSGTYNTVENTVARYPTVYPNPVQGLSQETNVNAPANGYLLNGYSSACAAGTGQRWRTIGTSEEIKAVFNSNSSTVFSTNARDGIGYAYFSYGNVNTSGQVLSDSANYGYLQLNGVDPIWASYGIGKAIDPGEPTGAGQLPGQADLPTAICANSFPCPENQIWGGGASFPNLRNGTYRSWSLLRLIATGTSGTNASTLISAAEKAAVLDTPDFVPVAKQTITAAENPFGYAITDNGLLLLRSHYQQYDGAGVNIGSAPVNDPSTAERGGDSGGLVIPTSIGVTLSASKASNTENQLHIVQGSNSTGSLSPAARPSVP